MRKLHRGRIHQEGPVDSPFRVLGIALVVEEVGKGARLVFRYPSAPPPLSSAATDEASSRTAHGDGAGGGADTSSGTAAHDDQVGGSAAATSPSAAAASAGGLDPAARKQQQEESANLFFTLPDRTVAKLFRPKPPLCGQAMTLSVGGTVFCCRAVLLPTTSSSSGGSNQQQQSGGQMQSADAAQSPPKADSETEDNGASAAATAATAENSDVPSNNNATTTTKAPKLVLFSVIVALSPVRGYARTFRESGYEGIATSSREAGTQEPHIYMPSPRRYMPASSSSGGGDHYQASPRSTSRRKKGRDQAGDGLSSASFLAIRRAHVSLSRLCRVLEREERRCSYVSSQSAAFVKIRSEIKDGEGSSTSNTRGSGGGGPEAGPSPGSAASKPVDPGGESKSARPRHVRMGSNATAISIPQTPMSLSIADRGISTDTRITVDIGGAASHGGNPRHVGVDQELERARKQEESSQAIIELMFAYNTVGDGSSNVLGGHHDRLSLIHGNLARELAQVFHSLSRNDGNAVSFPTPSSLLSSRDGIVYINRHLAVPIEPVSGFRNAADCFEGFPFGPKGSPSAFDLHASTPQTVVRPYHTVLFPHAPPAELAKAMSDDRSPKDGSGGLDGAQGISAPPAASSHNQRLQRLLLMANPSKSLADIAVDAALSIPVTLQLASYLVESGTCTLAHVATRSARYAVSPSGGVERIRFLALPFSQRFGRAVPIFHAVAALTSSGQTLGEILSSASSGRDDVGIGNRIASMKAESRTARRDRQQRSNAAVMSRPRGGSYVNETIHSPTGPGQAAETATSVTADEVEDALYGMTLWLRAHHCIIELRDCKSTLDCNMSFLSLCHASISFTHCISHRNLVSLLQNRPHKN